MQNRNETCPICPNHCPAEAPKCEKGRAYFDPEETGKRPAGHADMAGGPKGHGHWGHGRHGEHADVDENSLPGLILKCGHRMLHHMHEGDGTWEKEFAALSDGEKEELKKLLKKLLAD